MMKFNFFLIFLLFHFYLCSISLSPYTRECNGQGILYSDSDYTTCECFDCFHGTTCENQNLDCVVNVAGGNPSLAQQYWEHVLLPMSQTLSDAYYRSPYELHSGLIPPEPYPAAGIDTYIRQSIINIHNFAQNADTTDKYIVYGQGGTQLINAAAYALASLSSSPLPVFAQAPYYTQYKAWAEFNTHYMYWNASENQISHATDIIEFVTHPNNPDGELRTPFYSQSSNLVYDMVYFWPTWTNITSKANHDIMLFSLSKLSGHAGTRFGWALVKDKQVAEQMRSFINLVNIHTSLDTVHRAITILDTMVEQNGEFFSSISQVMEDRYNSIIPLFEGQSRFSLESVTSPPTWFYLWIKCNEDSNCYQVFFDAQIAGESGTHYGASEEYIRIQLTVRTADYQLFLTHLQNLLQS